MNIKTGMFVNTNMKKSANIIKITDFYNYKFIIIN